MLLWIKYTIAICSFGIGNNEDFIDGQANEILAGLQIYEDVIIGIGITILIVAKIFLNQQEKKLVLKVIQKFLVF